MPSRSRRRSAPKRELIWTTTLFQGVAAGVTTANIPTPLVNSVDWARGNAFERGCVLLAIRGWYQVVLASSATSVPFSSFYIAISKGEVNEDHSITNWSASAAYNSEDVLYCDGGHVGQAVSPFAAATPYSTPAVQPLARQVDIKAKRKLNSDDTINWQFVTPSASQDWTVSGVIRCLLALP